MVLFYYFFIQAKINLILTIFQAYDLNCALKYIFNFVIVYVKACLCETLVNSCNSSKFIEILYEAPHGKMVFMACISSPQI